jgi:hypothetical protein
VNEEEEEDSSSSDLRRYIEERLKRGSTVDTIQ